jgi:hypothetical protein
LQWNDITPIWGEWGEGCDRVFWGGWRVLLLTSTHILICQALTRPGINSGANSEISLKWTPNCCLVLFRELYLLARKLISWRVKI